MYINVEEHVQCLNTSPALIFIFPASGWLYQMTECYLHN